jgi:FtsH-binding integral membrane protein
MKAVTRDNLIYLAVGLTVAALVAVDTFNSASHDRPMWVPSTFAFRLVAYMGLLDYFVARETRKARATLPQTVGCVLVASMMHMAIAFTFRRTFSGHSSITLWGLAILELFLVVQLMVFAVRHLRPKSRPI